MVAPTLYLPNGQVAPRQSDLAGLYQSVNAILESRIQQLELELYGPGYQYERLTSGTDQFTRQAIVDIADLARVMYLKNPIVQRGIKVKTFYTFGQGITITAAHEAINDVVQAFMDDERNQAELTRQQALQQKDVELQTDGNLFFVLFTNASTGRVRVRSIPLTEIIDIVCNPEDSKEPWLYRRSWATRTSTALSARMETQQAYYPDWRYTPRARPATAQDGLPIMWDAPVYHVKVGGFSDWLFGLSPVYAQIDWARAYKVFLESIHSYTQAISRIAVKVTTGGGAGGVADARTRLASALSATDRRETNPPPATGSAFIRADQMADYEALNVRGLNVDPEDGRRFLLMVAAGAGLPETFYADASVGTLATAKSLDRPTELMMKDRQQLWRSIWLDIVQYVVQQAVIAPRGPLRSLADVRRERDGDQIVATLDWRSDPTTGDPYDAAVAIDFPEIIDIDVKERIEAVILADSSQKLHPRTIARLLLLALNVDDVDGELAAMGLDDWQPGDFGDGVVDDAALDEAVRRIVKAVHDR